MVLVAGGTFGGLVLAVFFPYVKDEHFGKVAAERALLAQKPAVKVFSHGVPLEIVGGELLFTNFVQCITNSVQ